MVKYNQELRKGAPVKGSSVPRKVQRIQRGNMVVEHMFEFHVKHRGRPHTKIWSNPDSDRIPKMRMQVQRAERKEREEKAHEQH